MDILLGGFFFVHIVVIMATMFSISKHMIVTSASNADTCPYIHEPAAPDKRIEAKFNIMAQDDVRLVNSYEMTTPKDTGGIRPLNSRIINNFVNIVHFEPHEWREDQMYRCTQLKEQKDTQNDWQREVLVLDNYIAYWTNVLSMLSRFPHLWKNIKVRWRKKTFQLTSNNLIKFYSFIAMGRPFPSTKILICDSSNATNWCNIISWCQMGKANRVCT